MRPHRRLDGGYLCGSVKDFVTVDDSPHSSRAVNVNVHMPEGAVLIAPTSSVPSWHLE